jgi:hypothetical protein
VPLYLGSHLGNSAIGGSDKDHLGYIGYSLTTVMDLAAIDHAGQPFG